MEKPFSITFSNGLGAIVVRVHRPSNLRIAINNLKLGLPKPTLVLVGGAGELSNDDIERLHPLFMEILAPLAERFDMYVVDGGTNAGVMRLMGQARTKIRATFPLVGVAAIGTVVLPNVDSSNPEASPLESNHTHFILVPGTNWGDESTWIDKVASVLAENEPSGTVLVNGGEIARKDVDNSLAAGRPVVVIAGTGRLADELATNTERSPLLKVVNLAEASEKLNSLLTDLLKGD